MSCERKLTLKLNKDEVTCHIYRVNLDTLENLKIRSNAKHFLSKTDEKFRFRITAAHHHNVGKNYFRFDGVNLRSYDTTFATIAAKATCCLLLSVRMFAWWKISSLLLAFTGLLAVSKAIVITTFTMIAEPRSGYVFDNDTIKITCEVTSNVNRTITWHYKDPNTPVVRNSSTTTITTRTEGNTTFSFFTTTNIRPKTGKVLYIYCKSTAVNGANTDNSNRVFTYVRKSDIPRLQVISPQTQAVPEGDNRILLSCHVLSNINIKQATIKWMHNNELLRETKSDLVAHEKANVSILLQCLSQKHLGEYTCLAHANVYKLDWQAQAVTSLTGELSSGNESSGYIIKPIVILHVVLLCWSLRNIIY